MANSKVLIAVAVCLLTLGLSLRNQAIGQTDATVRQIIVPDEDRFTPFAITVRVGQTVQWVNQDTDDHTLVSASDDHTLKLWDVPHLKELAVLKGHRGPVRQVATSLDGKTIASAGADKTLKLWDVVDGKLLDTIPGRSRSLIGVAFTPDGRRIATAGGDGTVKCWAVPSR